MLLKLGILLGAGIALILMIFRSSWRPALGISDARARLTAGAPTRAAAEELSPCVKCGALRSKIALCDCETAPTP